MAKKTITNKQYYNNNKRIRELLEQDFEKLISYNGKRHIWNESGEILMSPTRFISFFRELNMAKIPFQRLEEAKTIGIQVMLCLEQFHNERIRDLDLIDYLSEQVRQCFIALINLFISLDWTIKAVEKHIGNGTWHCFVDCIVSDSNNIYSFVEIKTRSNFEITYFDKIQLAMNMQIGGKQILRGYLVIINKKTYEAKEFLLSKQETNILLRQVSDIFRIMQVPNYCLIPRNYKK